jgi:surface antigen
MNKKVNLEIATVVALTMGVSFWGRNAQADTLQQAQNQVQTLTNQSNSLTDKMNALITDNKKYQKELLQTQIEVVERKEKIADFVHNVQASNLNQGYFKMLLSSKSINQLIENVSIANNFAKINQSNLKSLQKTVQKLQDTSNKNNATIANISREEKSIQETLKAKQQLIANIKKAQEEKNNEVQSVATPTPTALVSPQKSTPVNTPTVEQVLSDVSISSSNQNTNSSNSQSNNSGNQVSPPQNNEPTSPNPTIKFVKMSSDGVGFDGGQCTYGVDEMLGGDVPNWWGNAVNWFSNAQAQGLPTGSTPVSGALVVYGANANIGGYLTGYQGHVGVVQSVQGSNIVVKEMNGTAGEWAYDTRVGSSTSGVIGYIYIK